MVVAVCMRTWAPCVRSARHLRARVSRQFCARASSQRSFALSSVYHFSFRTALGSWCAPCQCGCSRSRALVLLSSRRSRTWRRLLTGSWPRKRSIWCVCICITPATGALGSKLSARPTPSLGRKDGRCRVCSFFPFARKEVLLEMVWQL